MGAEFMIASTILSAAGSAASGMASANAANYQAQVAKQNAQISEQKQKYLMEDYAQRENAMAKQDKSKMGGLQAQLASSGLDVNSGSTKGVLEGERDVLATNRQAHAKAFSEDWYAEKTKQVSNEAQSKLDKMSADNAGLTGLVNAGSSLLSGGSKLQKDYGYFGG